MWSSRLFWKLLLVYAGLNLTLAAGFLTAVTIWQRSQILEEVELRLHASAILLRSRVDEPLAVILASATDDPVRAKTLLDLQHLLVQLGEQTGSRMTLIGADGAVLADSQHDPETMENHRQRPELVQAKEAGVGTATRHSATLGILMFYLAVPIERDGETVAFVRVASDVAAIDRRVAAIHILLWLFAAGVGLVATGLTSLMVGRIIRPLAQLTAAARAIAAGDEQQRVTVDSRDEIGVLAEAFNRMQRDLAGRLDQLRDNSQRLATVLGSMDEGVIAVDAQENILLANDASRRLLNFATAEAVGRPLLEVSRCRPIHHGARQAIQHGRVVRNEFQTPGTNGRVLALRATCLPGDPCPGAVVVLHDISELRRLENLRSELVANVSHELKTPLASIKAYAETLRLGAMNDPDNNLKFIMRIEEQAERLHQLILDLLQLARVESGKEVFEIVELPLDEVAETCRRRFADAASAKQISLAVQPPAEPVRVRADEEGVSTILNNLVDNAIKYTPHGGQIVIRWLVDESQALIEVSDTGIGIDVADQARVFERFYRVDKARSRELGGTGLGLSIVKHLAQAFGGKVGIESQLGQGSTFRVRLPRVR